MKVAQYKYNNFYQMIEENAKKLGNKPALFEENEKISHEQLKKYIDSAARYLELIGVKKNDNVALLLTNSKEFIISFIAIGKLGAIPVPLNTFLKHDEIQYILKDSDTKVLITETKFKKELKNIFDETQIEKILWVDDYKNFDEKNLPFQEGLTIEDYEHIIPQGKLEDTAVILYTSGTTGKPKGVMLTYKNIFSNIENIVHLGDLSHKDRFIVYLPMFHTFTLTATVLLPLYLGSPLVIIKSIIPFSNIFKQTLLKRVTFFMGVPEVFNALSKAKLPWYFNMFNKIRFFISGGSALPESTLKKMEEKFKRAKLLEGYGLSECSPVVAVNTPEKQKPLSVGPPLPDYEVKIVDEELVELPTGEIGEIIVKGDNVMKGYYKNPEETERTIINGWLLTGDLGYLDKDGFLYIVDRKKDLIISKGINIYPREIEEVLNAYPDIHMSAVVGKKDPNYGEIPIAFVQLNEEVEQFDEKNIKRYLKEKLANYKIPKNIYVLEELPKNATGKVLKRVLKERLNNGDFG